MSSTRLQPLREPQVLGTAPRRQSLRNLQPVRSPQSQRRSLGTHSKSPLQATRILSPGPVVSPTTLKPMPRVTSVVDSSRSTPRLVQVPQLKLKEVSLQTERQQAEVCRSQKAELVQMVEQRQEQEYVGLGAESLRAEMEEVQQIQEIERSEVENQSVAQELEARRLRMRERAIEDAERVQIEKKLLLKIERLQRERCLAEQQQEVNRTCGEEDEQEKRATLFQRLSWQQQEAGCIRKEDKEEEQAGHSEYDRVSHKIQEIMGLEKELLVEDTDLQPLLANSDLTRMQKVAALLHYQVDGVKLRVRDPKTQVMAASAAGGGFALGTAGAVTGAIVGGAVGAGAGLPAALFTFGWSIPISAIVGGGAGLGLGASAGGAVGAIGGGTVGLQVYNYRTRVAALKESPDLASLLDSALAGA